MTEQEIQTAQWLKLKYEYYLAARTLWLNNQMQMGALMFAYAVEAQIKHALGTFPNELAIIRYVVCDALSPCWTKPILLVF
jgi:hypothetical protein